MSIWLLSLLASFVLILARNGKIKRCAPVVAPAPARITSTRSASRRPKSNLSANAIAADRRSVK